MLVRSRQGQDLGAEPVSKSNQISTCFICQCRIRKKRIKCDQDWPVCQRCIADSRICEGYGIWGGGGKPYGPDGYKSKRPESHSILQPLRSMPSRLSADQHTTFRMLKLKVGIKLAGVFGSEFWERLVIQASFNEPAILHALAAIGSAYRSDRLSKDWQVSKASLRCMDKEGTQALLEYNEAIRCLKVHLRQTDICSLRVTLITCMLFICFEYMRHNLRTGDTHLLNGLRLLSTVQVRNAQKEGELSLSSSKDSSPNSVDDQLVEAFARLDLQCALFGLGSRHVAISRTQSLSCSALRNPKTPFSSPNEARKRLDGLLSWTYHLLMRCCQNESENTPDTDELLHDRDRIRAGLDSWIHIYEVTLTQPTLSISTTLCYMVLRAYYTMAVIIAAVSTPHSHEMDFDTHTADFIFIIEIAVDIWNKASLHRLAGPGSLSDSVFGSKRTFTVDVGYIPVLYYTALKCRVPRIRRQAMKLMIESPHREGVWDGKLSAAIARRVVEIEEGDFFKPYADVIDQDFDALDVPRADEWERLPLLPETSRIRQVDVILPQEGVADTTLECRRRCWDESRGWHIEVENYNVTFEF